MLGFNGGLLGIRRLPDGTSAPGIWTQNEQSIAVKNAIWPGGDPYFSNVVLHMGMDGSNNSTYFLDRSNSSHTATAYGNAVISNTQSKFNGTSAYFDGSGDYVRIPDSTDLVLGSSAFTIEFWVYFLGLPAAAGTWVFAISKDTFGTNFTYGIGFGFPAGTITNRAMLISTNNTNTTLVTYHPFQLNTWYHIAVVGNGSTVTPYIDGVQKTAGNFTFTTGTSDLTIGCASWNNPGSFLYGFIDDLRITKAVARYTQTFQPPVQPNPVVSADPYFSNVSLLMHMNGANASTTFRDHSNNSLAISVSGNAQISTAQSKFGGASCQLDGSGDYLSIPSSTVFDLGNTYTIECWVRPSTTPNYNFGIVHRGFYTSGSSTWTGVLAFSIRCLGAGGSGNLRFYFYGTNNTNEQYINVSSALTANTWSHIAMVRSGTNGAVYVDGVSSGTISGLNTPSASSEALRIGRWDFSAANEDFNGYIEELRITKDVARYTANFTPSTAAFPNA